MPTLHQYPYAAPKADAHCAVITPALRYHGHQPQSPGALAAALHHLATTDHPEPKNGAAQ
ncbi:hypothetical protein TPA0598_04_02990 [Streptomyces lydicamycinicus]|uniref:Uncharacterized protein n=1 Tax=Streptomyces lydicamycinicus TaxID=1546107 RepID=A0A0P4R6W8_9ACTN|nr:hypothetical protein [Streptomyces lydicamycinicus]GAO08663.1 hypothetical protein TPA0598_04_02990 [Streptomyces lydicamycinicus]